MRQPQQRMSASERRETIIQAAITVFAKYGLYGASTEEIAAIVGVSQPYLFRLFGTKKDLFLAAVQHVMETMMQQFEVAVQELRPNADSLTKLEEIGKAFHTHPEHQAANRLLLQSIAAAEDPDIRRFGHDQIAAMTARVQELTGIESAQAQQFVGYSLLTTIYAVLGLPTLERW